LSRQDTFYYLKFNYLLLHIICPVFNRLDKTKKFINSILTQDYKSFVLYIIDDGSTDGTSQYLSNLNLTSNIVVLRGNGDLFWGGAINLGVEFVKNRIKKGDLLAFANNDIEFECYNSISSLIYSLRSNTDFHGMHSIVVDHQGTILSSGCEMICWPFFITRHPFRGKNISAVNRKYVARVNMINGRFMIFDEKVLKFDFTIRYQHYMGDIDLSYRLSKFNGLKFGIATASVVILDQSNSSILDKNESFIKSLTSIKSSNNFNVKSKFIYDYCPALYIPFALISTFLKGFLVHYRLFRNYS